jgi:imidazole glycerol phosphate synthase glutamine amidotransferase subunit
MELARRTPGLDDCRTSTMADASTLGLIDYGAGNLLSVRNALASLGAGVRIVREPGGLDGLGKLILPGVGAFGDCAANLRAQGLWDPIRDWVAVGRPYLGICLGYQILFDGGDESPETPGFGLFRGTVDRFAARSGLKVPHMGWNEVRQSDPSHPMWLGIPDGTHFYFVHSFRPVPADEAVVAGRSDYDGWFAAALAAGPVWGVQFHPERSQDAGLRLLANFLSQP